jgi:hypothetical protein
MVSDLVCGVLGAALAALALQLLGGDLGGGYFAASRPALSLAPEAALVFLLLGVLVAIGGSLWPAVQALQVQAAVASGVLREGDQLPSVRALAEQLRVNRNTIARAYGELEHAGAIENRQGSGCFVRAARVVNAVLPAHFITGFAAVLLAGTDAGAGESTQLGVSVTTDAALAGADFDGAGAVKGGAGLVVPVAAALPGKEEEPTGKPSR